MGYTPEEIRSLPPELALNYLNNQGMLAPEAGDVVNQYGLNALPYLQEMMGQVPPQMQTPQMSHAPQPPAPQAIEFLLKSLWGNTLPPSPSGHYPSPGPSPSRTQALDMLLGSHGGSLPGPLTTHQPSAPLPMIPPMHIGVDPEALSFAPQPQPGTTVWTNRPELMGTPGFADYRTVPQAPMLAQAPQSLRSGDEYFRRLAMGY